MSKLRNLHLAFTATYKGNDKDRLPLFEATFHDFKTRDAFLNSTEKVLGEKLSITNYEVGRQFAVTISKAQIEKIEQYIDDNKIEPNLIHFVKEMQPDTQLPQLLYLVNVDNRNTIKILTDKLERAGVEMLGDWGFNKPVIPNQANETLKNLGLLKSREEELLGDTLGQSNTAQLPAIRVNAAAYEHLMEKIRNIERPK